MTTSPRKRLRSCAASVRNQIIRPTMRATLCFGIVTSSVLSSGVALGTDSPFSVPGLSVSVSGTTAQVSWHTNDTAAMLVGFGTIKDGYSKVALSCLTPPGGQVRSGDSDKVAVSGTSRSSKVAVSGTSRSKVAVSGTSKSAGCGWFSEKVAVSGTSKVAVSGTSKVAVSGTSKVAVSGTSKAEIGDVAPWGQLELVFDCSGVFALATTPGGDSEFSFEIPLDASSLADASKSSCNDTVALN